MKKFLKNKKILIGGIVILLIASYFIYVKLKTTNQEPAYSLGKVKKGDLEVTVSGTGNIISENEFNLKAKTAGEVVYLGAKDGDRVNTGKLILKLDTKEIERQIRNTEESIKDAEIALESAKLSLNKLESQYLQTIRGDNYKKALNEGLTLLNNFYNFYPNYFKNIYDIYFQKDLDNYYNNLKYYETYKKEFLGRSEKLEKNYDQLKITYNQLSERFRVLNNDNNVDVENLIKDTHNFVLLNYDFISQGAEMVRYLKEQTTLNNLTHEKQKIIDNHYSNLSSYLNSFDEYKKNIFNVINQVNSYYDIVNNYDFDKKSQELNIKQKENSLVTAKNKLNDLKENLKDYYIYAPFSGTIANFNIKLGDLINSGTILGILISNQNIAEVSLSEVDVANVKIGQEAKLTFDALPDLKIKGEVIDISPLAEIEQGVVNYRIKIALKNNDQRIKKGMSVEAEIITNKKENTILVPISAIKEDDNGKYIEVVNIDKVANLNNFYLKNKIQSKENLDEILLNNNDIKLESSQIIKKYIKIGLSDNEFTEILEGLNENEIIIVKVNNNNTQPKQRNLFTPQFRFGQPKK